jgi:hypothetical protein
MASTGCTCELDADPFVQSVAVGLAVLDQADDDNVVPITGYSVRVAPQGFGGFGRHNGPEAS